MNFLSWLLGLSVLIILVIKAVALHRVPVCRQEAWLKSTELVTRSLLSNPMPRARDWHLGCRIHLLREHNSITWQQLPTMKKHHFELELKGDL